jgi:Tn3 transposase DDE domain
MAARETSGRLTTKLYLEDELSALGLVVNMVTLWNTRYMDAALCQLRAGGQTVHAEDVARLSPLGYDHINLHGHYSFSPPPPTRSKKAPWMRNSD